MHYPGGDSGRSDEDDPGDAKAAWIDIALQDGMPVPEPVPEAADFSGRFNVRIPRSLHRELVRRAEEEDVSLNQIVTYLLSTCIGRQLAAK